MAFILSDRVKESSTTTGNGILSLDGAITAFQSFSTGIGEGNETYYAIENEARWEVGIGTYTSNTLVRNTVLESSNSDNLVDLSGVSTVFCTYPAGRSVHLNSSGWLDLTGYSGVIQSVDGNFEDVTISGNLNIMPYDNQFITMKRSTSGNFFHAYIDDVYDRTIALYSNGSSSPMWKFGLKSAPTFGDVPPDHGYIYGEDGSAGIVANSTSDIAISNSDGFVVTHQGEDLLRVSNVTGVFVNTDLELNRSTSATNFILNNTWTSATSYERLRLYGQAADSFVLASEKGVAGGTRRDLTLQITNTNVNNLYASGHVSTSGGIKLIDVVPSNTSNKLYNNAGVLTWDGSAVSSVSYTAGSGMELVGTEFHATGVSAVSGWARHYVDTQDHSAVAVSGWTQHYVDNQDHSAVGVSGWAEYTWSQDDVALSGWAGATFVTTDTNTTYTAGSGMELVGTVFHATGVNAVSGWAGYRVNTGDAAVSGWAAHVSATGDAAVSGWSNYTWSQDDTAISGWANATFITTDSDTTYTAGSGMELVGTEFHATGVNAVSGWARNYVDTQDHSAVATSGWAGGTFSTTDTDTTYTAGSGMELVQGEFHATGVNAVSGWAAYTWNEADVALSGWAGGTFGAGGGDLWSDPVDAVITPDGSGTRDFGTASIPFSSGYFDNTLFAGSLVVSTGSILLQTDNQVVGNDDTYTMYRATSQRWHCGGTYRVGLDPDGNMLFQNDASYIGFRNMGSPLRSDADGEFTLRDGVNPYSLSVYSTYTSTTDYERLRFYGQTGDNFVIAAESGSAGGSSRSITIDGGGTTAVRIQRFGEDRILATQFYNSSTVRFQPHTDDNINLGNPTQRWNKGYFSKELIISELSDHSSTPGPGSGLLWVKDDAPNVLYFTDDAGTDWDLIGVSGWAAGTFSTTDTDTTYTAGSGMELVGTTFHATGVNAVSGWARNYVDTQDHSAVATSGWARNYVDTQDHSAVATSGWAEYTWNQADLAVSGWAGGTFGAGGGDLWSDPVDAVITPDGSGTRDLATASIPFASGFFDDVQTRDVTVDGTFYINGYLRNTTDNDNAYRLLSSAHAWYDNFADYTMRLDGVGLTLTHDHFLAWSATSPGGTKDTKLYREEAQHIGLRDEVNPNSLSVYSTYTSATDYERIRMYGQTGDNFVIAVESGVAGGTNRNLEFDVEEIGIGIAPLQALHIGERPNGVGNTIYVSNNIVSTSNISRLYLRTAPAGGDAYALFQIDSTTNWAFGIDNSDNDHFKIANNSTVGTNDAITIATTSLEVQIEKDLNMLDGGINIAERADHSFTPTAGSGELWVKDDAPNTLYFTDDAGTDWDLIGVSGWAAGTFSTTDNDTTYTAGSGMELVGTEFHATGVNAVSGWALGTFSTAAISTFGATLTDDVDAATARATIGLDELSKSITIEDPTATEDISLWFSNKAITITEIRVVLVGSSTPSVTWTVRHGTDRSATGAEAVTGGTATTSTTSGSDVTVFNDATVVVDSFIWLETTAQSGTVDEMDVTIFYTID